MSKSKPPENARVFTITLTICEDRQSSVLVQEADSGSRGQAPAPAGELGMRDGLRIAGNFVREFYRSKQRELVLTERAAVVKAKRERRVKERSERALAEGFASGPAKVDPPAEIYCPHVGRQRTDVFGVPLCDYCQSYFYPLVDAGPQIPIDREPRWQFPEHAIGPVHEAAPAVDAPAAITRDNLNEEGLDRIRSLIANHRHGFRAVGGDFPDTCICGEFRDSATHGEVVDEHAGPELVRPDPPAPAPSAGSVAAAALKRRRKFGSFTGGDQQ